MRIIRVERPAFFADAACRGTQHPAFFPEPGRSSLAARECCARCPVADECLEYALDDQSLIGIWGGMSEDQRDQLRRKRNR